MFRAYWLARISSSNLSWMAAVSRFWVFWRRKTIRKVTIGPVAKVVEIAGGVISGLCNEPDSAVRRRWRLHHGEG
jgi:hypothetical protein